MRFRVEDDLRLGEPGIYCIVILQNATSVDVWSGDYIPNREWCKWQSDLIKVGSLSSSSGISIYPSGSYSYDYKIASISFEGEEPQATFVYGAYEERGVSLTTILSVILVILIILLIFVCMKKNEDR